ncbi:MAG: DUF6316 family protein [Pseudomonadales bacterium]
MKTNNIGRFEGRLFAHAGRLCMVVEADELSGVGRISFREDGENRVVDMPLSEISQRIAANSDLLLDNARAPESSKRIVRKPDGWFFSTREGLQGPFQSGQEAEQELGQHMVASQA